jgi:ssDNA-binding Zn-finger/Zn-ribbon topoisomerase 1
MGLISYVTVQNLGKPKPSEPNPRCPKCQSAMKLRLAKRGKFVGQKFWGCSRYPSCNEIVAIKTIEENHK